MIRRAVVEDAPQLLALMRKLAEFEGYANRFAVTIPDLVERGLASLVRSQFTAWVAATTRGIEGYVVAYVIPFTFDLRPTVVLKELFVVESARGSGMGQELFTTVIDHARSIDARLIRWQVLPDNTAAKRFYDRQGGMPESDWDQWLLDLDASPYR